LLLPIIRIIGGEIPAKPADVIAAAAGFPRAEFQKNFRKASAIP
jgi:hypothetical protein